MSKILFITGASRGIGREIALKFAKDGACIAIAAKSNKPHPTLEGTIYTVADEVEKAGGRALPITCDVRFEEQVQEAIEQTVSKFGGIDCLVNNASAINLTNTLDTEMKRYDLMHSVNVRATFMCSKLAIPHLKKSTNPHILTLSPPLTMHPKWFGPHLAYTMSKYGMSMCTLGLAEELKELGIAANSLWPRTTIATDAVRVHFPKEIYESSRKPTIVADAAYWIMTQPAKMITGQFFIDEEILRSIGVDDFKQYAINPDIEPFDDLFV